ncbi:MHYT domain-containing protein [Sphingomonas sp. gentR]|uniref:MHYT domain-containing protein n=1 Tax=unclassified Sphingomonas TaxID=196159 RepID=UPI000972D45C|nr:MHYT domain-containing protein [Sphingomonas sp. LK11]APX66390.1 hypothetical protein AV944_11715 [Sphingomonas sp. LK11]
MTLTSIAAPCLTIWIALGHIRQRRDLAGCLAVGGLTMIGIGAMHLIGMAALIVPAQIRYDPWGLAAAFLGATLLLAGAFHIYVWMPGRGRTALSVGFAALGIVVLHFGGMTATTLVPGGVVVDPGLHPLQPLNLARVVCLVTATIVVALVAAALLDRLLTDLRGLTQATHKGIASGVATYAAARSIVRAIVGLGQSLNLPVVAEGGETAEQHRMVLEEGCPQAQGYLFGRPAQPLVGAQPLARTLR